MPTLTLTPVHGMVEQRRLHGISTLISYAGLQYTEFLDRVNQKVSDFLNQC